MPKPLNPRSPTTHLHIRVPAADLRAWGAAAADASRTVSDWVRVQLNKAAGR